MKLVANMLLLTTISITGILTNSAHAESLNANAEGTCVCKLDSHYNGTDHTSTYRWILQYVYFADSARLITLESVDEYSYTKSVDANEACRKVAAQYSVCK